MHDPPAYLFDYCPPELRMEVKKEFIQGFGNCMASVAYLVNQGQLPKARVVGQCASIVPGLDKRCELCGRPGLGDVFVPSAPPWRLWQHVPPIFL